MAGPTGLEPATSGVTGSGARSTASPGIAESSTYGAPRVAAGGPAWPSRAETNSSANSSADLYPQAGDASALPPAVLREIAEESGVVTSASGSSDRYNAHLVVGAIDRGEPAPSVSRVVRERVLVALAARRAGGAS